MPKRYTDEFLISELHRFVRENGKVPTQSDMQGKFGYPSFWTYHSRFGSFNLALKKSDLKLNHYQRKLDGTETCSYCGKRADEILNFKQWLYPNDIRYCHQHGDHGVPNYVTGNLDINSSTGRGRTGEILILKTLDIGTEYDCNLISRGYKIDLYHDEYKKIDVKTSLLGDNSNVWYFNINAKKEADTYICVGLSLTGKYIRYIWVVPNEDKIRNLTGLSIYCTPYSLSTHGHWEVDKKQYIKIWQEMIIHYQSGECKIFK